MLLWPFNKYPGTDYETFNWEWILKTVKEWVATMQAFKDSITAGWVAMQAAWRDYQDNLNDGWQNYQDGLNDQWQDYQDNLNDGWQNYQDGLNDQWQEFIDDTYKDQITEILEDHPEWVTTVMDGAITEQKINTAFLKEIKNPFVTPEMYGAVGNGLTDDTLAVQSAINAATVSGLSVLLIGDYLVSNTIILEDVNIISLNNASIIDDVATNPAINIKNNVVAENLKIKSVTQTKSHVVVFENSWTNTIVDNLEITLDHNADGIRFNTAPGFTGGVLKNVRIYYPINGLTINLGATGWLTATTFQNIDIYQYSNSGWNMIYDPNVDTYQFSQNTIENITAFCNTGNTRGFILAPGCNNYTNLNVFSDNESGVCYSLSLPTTNTVQEFWVDKIFGGMLEGQIENIEQLINYNIIDTTIILRNTKHDNAIPYNKPKMLDLLPVVDFNDNNNVTLTQKTFANGAGLHVEVTGTNARIRGSIPADALHEDGQIYSIMAILKATHNNTIANYLVPLAILEEGATDTRYLHRIRNPLNSNETIDKVITGIVNNTSSTYRYINIGFGPLAAGDTVEIYELKLVKGPLNRIN